MTIGGTVGTARLTTSGSSAATARCPALPTVRVSRFGGVAPIVLRGTKARSRAPNRSLAHAGAWAYLAPAKGGKTVSERYPIGSRPIPLTGKADDMVAI